MSRKVEVDMNGVESFTRCPEGEWLARLKKIEVGEVKDSRDDCLKAQFEVIKGGAKGTTVFETFSLNEKALWKLKGFLDAVGMKSTGRLTLNLDKMEGKVCIIDVIHDEFNGTKRAKIASYIKPEDEDDEDEDLDDESIDDEDDEEETPKKSKKAAKAAPAKKSKKRPEPEEDDDEEDDEDEDDDEEDEPPAKSKKSKKTAPAKKSSAKSKKKSKDEDEDDDWEEDED